MNYIGIADKKKIKNFLDSSCEMVKDDGKHVRVSLFIHAPWLQQQPDVLGIKTKKALRDGVLQVYTAHEAVTFLTSAEMNVDVATLKTILSPDDYDTYYGSLERKIERPDANTPKKTFKKRPVKHNAQTDKPLKAVEHAPKIQQDSQTEQIKRVWIDQPAPAEDERP